MIPLIPTTNVKHVYIKHQYVPNLLFSWFQEIQILKIRERGDMRYRKIHISVVPAALVIRDILG